MKFHVDKTASGFLLVLLVVRTVRLYVYSCIEPLPATSPLASSESRGSIGGGGRARVAAHPWGVGGHILVVASRPPRGGLGRL